MADVVTLEYRKNARGFIAIITLNNEKKLNVRKDIDRKSARTVWKLWIELTIQSIHFLLLDMR
jgi:hypothetical protein